MLDGYDLETLYDDVGLKAQVEQQSGRAQREKKLRPLKNITAKPKARKKEVAKKESGSRRAPRVRGR
jgi:hypothetical protein